MRVLILGTDGQVGYELLRAAWPAGTSVTGFNYPDFDMAQPDSLEPLLAGTKPEVVINATAHTAVDKAESEPELAFAINRDGPGHLATLCHRLQVPVLHISTDYVFDGSKPAPYCEDDPVGPLNVYGASKEAGEAAVRRAATRHLILRTSWVYGVHGHNFIKTMIRLGRERPELSVVDDQQGAPTAASSIAAALAVMAQAVVGHSQAPWGTYHFTDAGVTTWHGLADHIFARQQRLTGSRPRLRAIPSTDYPQPARRPANSCLDCTRIQRAFGITPASWQSQVDRVLDHLMPPP